MEQPAEQDPLGKPFTPSPRPLLEDELRRQSYDVRIVSGDATLLADHVAKVLARLRAVAPDLVAAAEEEVELGL